MITKYETRVIDADITVVVRTAHEAEDQADHVTVEVGNQGFTIPRELAEALSNALRAHVNRRFM